MAYLYLCVVTVSFVQRWVIEHTVLQVTLYITGKWDTHRYNRWTRVEDKDVLDIFLLLFIKKLGQHLFSVTHAIYISGGLIFFFLCVCVCVCVCVRVCVCLEKGRWMWGASSRAQTCQAYYLLFLLPPSMKSNQTYFHALSQYLFHFHHSTKVYFSVYERHFFKVLFDSWKKNVCHLLITVKCSLIKYKNV